MLHGSLFFTLALNLVWNREVDLVLVPGPYVLVSWHFDGRLVSCVVLIRWLTMIMFSLSNGGATSFLYAIKTCSQWGRGAKNTDRTMSGPEGCGSCFQQQNWLHDALWLDVSPVYVDWYKVLVCRCHFWPKAFFHPQVVAVRPQGSNFNPYIHTLWLVDVYQEKLHKKNLEMGFTISLEGDVITNWGTHLLTMIWLILCVYSSSILVSMVIGGYCFSNTDESFRFCSIYHRKYKWLFYKPPLFIV